MVQRIANSFRGLPPHVDRAELTSAGLEGVVRAWKRWDDSREGEFDAYAASCARYAILEHLRVSDILSRRHRAEVRSKGLEGPIHVSWDWDDRAITHQLNDSTAQQPPTPEDLWEARESAAIVREVLGELPELMQRVLVSTVVEEKAPRVVAAELSLSSVQVSRLRRTGLARLRRELDRRE